MIETWENKKIALKCRAIKIIIIHDYKRKKRSVEQMILIGKCIIYYILNYTLKEKRDIALSCQNNDLGYFGKFKIMLYIFAFEETAKHSFLLAYHCRFTLISLWSQRIKNYHKSRIGGSRPGFMLVIICFLANQK